MDRPRIALLNASYETADTRRNFIRELDASVVEYVVSQGDIPADPDVDGAVITGSRASVYWDEPWIAHTRDWVRSAVDDGLPVLGVCWGHQLLADALGGTVADMGEYEIGYREIEHDDDHGLLAELPSRFLAFTTHSDEVIEVPPGTHQVAANDVSIQGFAGDHVWGVQFHPEYDMATAEAVTMAKDDLDPERKEAALASITEENYRKSCISKRLFDTYLDRLQTEDPAGRNH